MAELTIKDFKGMNLKEGLWDQGFSEYTQCMDFYGLGDDQTFVSYGGVLQGALAVSTMAQAAGNNAVTSCITDFAFFNPQSFTYGIDIANPARLYRWNQAVPNWTYVSSIATSGIGSHLAVYNNNLYYTSNNYLGYYDGTASNANYQQFTQANILPRPMKVFSGYLFIANGRYVDRYDGTTYLSQKLALPLDFIIRSMEIFRDGMYISADNGQFSRIFVWDGSSPTYNDSINLNNEQYAPTLQATQGILWAVGNRGGSQGINRTTALTPIYIFQQGQPDLLFELPLRRDVSWNPNTGVASYQNGLLVGSSEVLPASYETGVGGVWFIGKELSTGLFHASLLFGIIPAAGTTLNLGGVFSSGGTQSGSMAPAMYTCTSASGTFTMYQAASPSVSPQAAYTPTWMSLPIDAASTKNKIWSGMRLNFEPMNTAGQGIEISYRLDSPSDPAGWTVLKTFNYSASDSTSSPYSPRFSFIPLGRVARTIAIRIKFLVGASLKTIRLHSFTLYYEELDH